MSGPVGKRGVQGVWRVLVLPAAVSVVALGVANGLLVEQATAKMQPDDDPDRRAVVKGSLGRLGLISAVALLIAFLARPNGWVLLVGLAGYQVLALLSQLGAAMRQARVG
jgi:hypothetical protein